VSGFASEFVTGGKGIFTIKGQGFNTKRGVDQWHDKKKRTHENAVSAGARTASQRGVRPRSPNTDIKDHRTLCSKPHRTSEIRNGGEAAPTSNNNQGRPVVGPGVGGCGTQCRKNEHSIEQEGGGVGTPLKAGVDNLMIDARFYVGKRICLSEC